MACTSTSLGANGLFWAIVSDSTNGSSEQQRTQGRLLGHNATPQLGFGGGLLQTVYDSKSVSGAVSCAAPFNPPTVVGGQVYTPTYAYPGTGTATTACPANEWNPANTTPMASGLFQLQ